MITPKIELYARFDLNPNIKTPKYICTKVAGYYPPMEQLKNAKGELSFYMLPSRSKKVDAPPYKLQGKNSLNFTGLYHFFIDDKMSDVCTGYPSDKKQYGKATVRNNPFYEYRNDAYLILMHQGNRTDVPSYFELIILENAKLLIDAYRKQLLMGGFDDALNLLREQAKSL